MPASLLGSSVLVYIVHFLRSSACCGHVCRCGHFFVVLIRPELFNNFDPFAEL